MNPVFLCDFDDDHVDSVEISAMGLHVSVGLNNLTNIISNYNYKHYICSKLGGSETVVARENVTNLKALN